MKIDQLTLNKESAIAAFHDAKNNGPLDQNWFGLPTEGYGFSNDARGTVGLPDFNKATVRLTQENQNIRFKLSY